MEEGKLLEIVKAPADWEVIQQENGFANIAACVRICDNPDDDTEQEINFSFENIYAKIVYEESGELAVMPQKLIKNGEFYECEFEKVACGGPYLLDFVLMDGKHTESALLAERRRHFCVGDVYIIAGQSNAAGMAKGAITEEMQMGVHILRNLERWDIASHPFNDFDYSKQGMFLAFAKKLKKDLNIPIGLVPAAMGGSPLSRWIKDERGDLYEKLIKSVKNNGIKAKAVLWYQGCSDVWENGTDEYLERFKKLAKFLREDLENDGLPIFTFQLNRQKFKEEEIGGERGYDYIREAQRRAAHEIKNTYVLPAIDCFGMSDFIHNNKASNIMLGERLARQVEEKLYGIGTGFADAPEIKKAYFAENRKITLEFDNVTEFLYEFNSSIADFPIVIEDETGAIALEDYAVSGNKISLSLAREVIGTAFVSGQTGSNPKNIIIDYGTQMPMLCFCKFGVEKGI